MAVLTVQEVTTAGLEVAEVACATAVSGGDSFVNDGRTILKVTDTATTAPTVTVASLVNCDQGHDHDLTVAVQSGEYRLIGPFPPHRFNDENGRVTFTLSSNTSVTAAAIRVPM